MATADKLRRLGAAIAAGDAEAVRTARVGLDALIGQALTVWLGRYLPQPDPRADELAADSVATVAQANGWGQRGEAPTWRAVWAWLASLEPTDTNRIAADVDAAFEGLDGRPLATMADALRLGRPDGPPWPWPDLPPELPDTWAVTVDAAYQAADEAGSAPAHHPLRPLFMAYADAHRADAPALVVAGSPGYVRQPDAMATAALATWTPAAGLPDVRAVMVDGEPMATEAPLRPVQAVRADGQLFALPGTRDAHSLILQRLRGLDAAGVDRRAVLSADTYATLALACALTGSATVDVATFGAWLAGRDVATVRNARDLASLRQRAWTALDAARAHFVLPDGNRLALLDVATVNLPLGTVRLTGWDWGRALRAGLGHWALTGALAHIGIRADGYGSVGRFVAALEDYAVHGSQSSRADRRSRWLVPERPGGPGPWFTVGAMDLLARAGYVWDPRNVADAARMRKLWQGIRAQLERRGYLVARTTAESVAGDTVEIQRFGAGGRGRPATVKARASARFCAAVTATNTARRPPAGVDARGFDAWPLARILDRWNAG